MLGAGSWGTALAIQFARAGRPTTLWARDSASADAMRRARSNARYLPGAAFPEGLTVTDDLAAAAGASELVIAVPSQSLRTVLENLRELDLPLARIAWATKGFELETGLLPHEVIAQVLPRGLHLAVLSGPTFAREVAAGLPTAIAVASPDEEYALALAASISTGAFRAYRSTDMVGVEVGGATKNVYAIGAGLSDGIGLGANARTALVTRGLAEMLRLGLALGAREETFMGLAGIGDLVLSCTDDHSRNRRFGLALGTGRSVEQARAEIGQVVEGYTAARSAHRVAVRLGVEMPIIEQIYRVLYEGVRPEDAAAALMQRPLASEREGDR
ncbi:MAG TPA: NAD(P)H-dependent glycerol-3-phosphate dehydrogenase [Gammaproteobacteria bacterium]|nr:NAD(P)H-dependent glycerol-3-phosphate dehydrogenase [Gammaproteobacteria bacterium]